MQFSRSNEYFSAARITGPRHNLLQLRLTKEGSSTPICECLPPVGSAGSTTLDQAKLVTAVLQGVASANKELATTYAVTHVRFVQNDSAPEEVYELLAHSIVKRLASGGDFAGL